MESRMVNSTTSLGSERNGNAKASYMQEVGLHKTSPSPVAANSATSGSLLLEGEDCPKVRTIADLGACGASPPKTTLFCSFPLERVQTILAKYASIASNCGSKAKVGRKILCLYCDRTFGNLNLRQKHVERCHSAKHLRRASLRKHQNCLTSTPCVFCDQFTSEEHTLKDLFKHLVEHHSNKYFGCIPCESRFLNTSHLADHHLVCPSFVRGTQESTQRSLTALSDPSRPEDRVNGSLKTLRRRQKTRRDDKVPAVTIQAANSEDQRRPCDVKNLRSKKLSVKSSRMILKRSKRLQAKSTESVKKKRTRELTEKKNKNDRVEAFASKLNEKPTKTASSFVNPYPEFDHFFQVKKITDHSIDNLKISSLTFDDVFDKAFFNRIRCNIQENLMHHIDGKLFKNEESETRISNFEKNANIPQEAHSLNSENYGCELSLNAIAPTTMLLSNQLGDDPESQIEYGSKPSKKKTQLKKDEVHYKYFTRRKYQASILEHKENRDLSKLDMWTQYVIKRRQQKIQDDKRTPKEILDYFAGEEYKNTLRREELNRILDRRGPFEDLKEEVSKKAALDKLNGESVHSNDDNITEIGELLNDILNRVFELAAESSVPLLAKNKSHVSEIPSYLNLRPSTDVVPENEIDRSDKIALICSSQETENFELPSNTVRGKNEKVELTGEWARSRIYVCAACGLKLQNIKQFLEHKSATHQYIWVQHYEFVGNQSELYRHLSIPVLGKVGVLEDAVQCKVWKRSDSRLCTKCGKQCNSLGELHRHILECGGDWTWMLARKKCKYRPFGAKSRRKRKGLVKRIYAQKSDVSPSEKKIYKKSYDKPSDAETIKRMLANLPPKRATRKIISLKDGFNQSRTRQVPTAKQSKFKCGKLLRQKPKEQQIPAKSEFKNGKKTKHNGSYRRSLRCLSKVLTSRILDTKSTLMVRRQYNRKLKNEQTKKHQQDVKEKENTPKKITRGKKKSQPEEERDDPKIKRTSQRIERHPDSNPGDKMSIKRFFPVKKKKKSDAINVDIKSTVPEDSSEKKEGNVEKVTSVNLRKRKVTNLDSNITKKAKVKKRAKSVKKQLRSSPRSVPSESKVQVNPEPPGDNQTEIGDFFGKLVPEESADVTEVAEVVDCGSHKDDQQEMVETEVHIERTEPEKSVDSSVKIENTNAGVSSPPKRKVKKPIRGLNDCIAMLTSKLGKSFKESATDNIFNSDATNQIIGNDNRKDEYLLKVPFSNEHFHLRINHEEAATADDCSHNVSKLPESLPETEDIYKDTIEQAATASIPEETAINCDNLQDSCQEDVLRTVENDIIDDSPIREDNEESSSSLQNEEVFSQLEKIPSDVSWDSSIVLQTMNEDENCSDSEDEIPLSSLLKSDHQTEPSKIDDGIREMLTTCDNDTPVPSDSETSLKEIEESVCQNDEKTDLKVTKKKEVAVLTEINANFCEHAENLTSSFESNSNKLEPMGRRILDESVLVNADLLHKDDEERSDARDISDLVSLEKYCEQQILSKLEKFSFFTKNSFEPDVRNESPSDIAAHEQDLIKVDGVEELQADTSEYKENVIGKHKQRKRTVSGRSVKNHRKQPPEGIPDTRKVSNKTEERLEFSESEPIGRVDVVFEKQDTLQVSVEIEDASTNEGSCEVIEDQNLSQFIDISNETVKLMENTTENVKELRRSSRNSKRITSYNETDLIDPLLDDLESDRTISRIIRETTKDIFGLKRKSRKLLPQKKTKNGHSDRKLNGDELFDLLKSAPDDNIVLSKPANTYFNTFDEISNEFNDENFHVFEDILEKSMAVIDENLSEPTGLTTDETTSVPVGQNPDDSSPKSRPSDSRKRNSKKCKNRHKNRNRQKSEEDESKSGEVEPVLVEDSDANTKDTDKPKTIYCDICDKCFSRVESLTKHKRTLTHISKLSELEAREAALKTKCDQKSTNDECGKDLSLLNILASVDGDGCRRCPSPFDVTVTNSNLKLADIINDVLNKPMLKKEDDSGFAQKEVEVRRCKSLAERKSFESESYKNVDYFNPEISNAAAGTILEKQITLLENIIENRSGIGYIDDISVSSSPSIDKNSSECNSKQVDADQDRDQSIKDTKTDKESFLKPSQYEEISEDSNLRNYDEQKSRKALNRDEELFLECCSLLKSGSEVSSYSKKSNNISKDVNKPCDESDWLETNYLSQQGNSDFAECYSDGSRIRTPLGDGFSQDSDSATLSSQWNMNNSCTPTKKQIWKEELKLKNKNLTFEEVFGSKDDNNLEDLHSMVSSFDRVISEVLNTELRPAGESAIKRCVSNIQEPYETPDHKESTSADARKVLTKGAMKIFEGLKVSIPTEDLNIDKILLPGPKSQTFTDPGVQPDEQLAVKAASGRVPNRSPNKKPRSAPKGGTFKKQTEPSSKVHDVYDFEETQDNSDVFTKPDFRSFRNSSEKCKRPEEGSDDDSRDCTDPFSFDAMSSSTSSVSEVAPVAKSRNQQNITKKKCMIMGRIFKNVVVKSKVEDEDIRNIPVVDNAKLVEDFVLNCPEPEASALVKKPRMTEEEMNLEFDKLLNKQTVKACSNKTSPNKRKQKIRNKKRSHCNSDSSDDEFKLQKHSLKRAKKKATNPEEDNCINLEQELRECIGVASRKSQRKCTSGKQNVLIEYWSSDESSFETLLEKQIVNSVAENHLDHDERKELPQVVHTDVKNCSKEPIEVDGPPQTRDVDMVNGKKASSRSNRRKRVAANPLYHWSSSSEDESRDLIEVRPIRDEIEDDDRPIQHGWIVGDSPKKLVTMLAQAKGKKIDIDSVKEHGRKRPSVCS